MAVKLRLRRMGKKKQPVYKVVAADSRSPRDGKFIEAIGLYNPKTEPATIEIKEDRALYWLNAGAQPTNTVRSLLSQTGVLLKRHLMKRGFTEEQITEKLEEWKKLKEAKLATKLKKLEKTKTKKETESSENSDNVTEVKGTASEEA